jgi:UDP-glucuronate decarboxylase
MIRWITDRLGTAAYSAAVGSPHLAVIDVRDLVDRGGNLLALARAKVDAAVAELGAGRQVVVCCDYGISRSNAVAAGALALAAPMPFSEAVRRVRSATGEAEIKVEVLAAVRDAIAETRPAAQPAPAQKRVLITGGSGFLGSALRQRLPAGWCALSPARNQMDLLGGPVDLDLLVRDHGIEVVVHLATPRVLNNNASLGQALTLMKNVLDVCRENRAHLVYLSSWEVYSGYRSCGLLADESLPANPGSTYGQGKYLCEVLLDRCHQQCGLAYTLLRCGPVYGEGGERPKFLGSFISKALRGEAVVTHRYRNGFPCLDLLHVEDAIEALVQAVDQGALGQFNIGSGRGTSTTDLARLVISLTGSASRLEHREIQADAPNVVMDTSRARTRLGWQPGVDLETGLRRIMGGTATAGLANREAA